MYFYLCCYVFGMCTQQQFDSELNDVRNEYAKKRNECDEYVENKHKELMVQAKNKFFLYYHDTLSSIYIEYTYK